jgi:hypothetical protein
MAQESFLRHFSFPSTAVELLESRACFQYSVCGFKVAKVARRLAWTISWLEL